MSQLTAYLSGLDWSPLLISVKTGIVATIISFFRHLCSTKSSESRTAHKGSGRWNSDTANGAATDGGRLFSAVIVQPEETVWSISL